MKCRHVGGKYMYFMTANSIPDDEIALLARKLRALHTFHKERRRSPSG
jgi:hypothetical protein